MRKISTDNITDMRETISSLEPSKPREVTAREVVGELASEMRAALKRGVTPADMIAALTPLGLDISPSTLTSYLRELEGNKKARKSGKKTAPQPGAEHTSPAPAATRATEIGAAPCEATELTPEATSKAPTDTYPAPGATIYRPEGG